MNDNKIEMMMVIEMTRPIDLCFLPISNYFSRWNENNFAPNIYSSFAKHIIQYVEKRTLEFQTTSRPPHTPAHAREWTECAVNKIIYLGKWERNDDC